MGFKNIPLKSILPALLLGLLFIGILFWKIFSRTEMPTMENRAQYITPNDTVMENVEIGTIQKSIEVQQLGIESVPGVNKEDIDSIQSQLDHDRLQQKQTKDLRIKLEQTNLELEEEKALNEINKLKNENMGTFNESVIDGQHSLPEIKIDYIGGDNIKKEAILSISGTSYHVRENSTPLSNIQVVSISNSSVTLHFSAPQNLTKVIEYKPE